MITGNVLNINIELVENLPTDDASVHVLTSSKEIIAPQYNAPFTGKVRTILKYEIQKSNFLCQKQ